MWVPEPGDVLRVDRRASVQFAGAPPLVFRVISVSEKPTYDGWAWVTGYVLNAKGEAVERRELFVQTAGLQLIRIPPTVRASKRRRV
ncbi:hypothetical protein BDK92_6720 [Micromonospora pisi]|uniref:Uncharacterized protein n=1 Tax=Micromonospora pisi TaxID=589240 RepID=A0A495JVF5_9ACTN|nr:hypothetical protein BDK92_6720 [Micromonospora pisi]